MSTREPKRVRRRSTRSQDSELEKHFKRYIKLVRKNPGELRPYIKGKQVPVWILVDSVKSHGLTPEEVSQKQWLGRVTPEEVQAAVLYAETYPERVINKFGTDDA